MSDNVQNAVDNLVEAIREDLREEFMAALSGGNANARVKTAQPRQLGRAPRMAMARPKGTKRTPEQLEQLTQDLLSAIRKTPGQRIEQLATALEVGTKELALPAIKLGEQKAIRTKGQRRGTQYFAK